MSDSVRPHRWQPTRLPHPWDSPGKNTGVGCYFLLQCMKVKSESEVAQLCPTLSDPMDCSLPGSSVHGILQARVLEWGAIAYSELHCWGSSKRKIMILLLPSVSSHIRWAPTLRYRRCCPQDRQGLGHADLHSGSHVSTLSIAEIKAGVAVGWVRLFGILPKQAEDLEREQWQREMGRPKCPPEISTWGSYGPCGWARAVVW